MCVDVSETLSSNCLHLMSEADSSVSGHAVKVRKPYIITKQRERWTEEEHNKFLEALKQYGRAWRRIEEHIGSKTTVQIRSHAQKFFSKVVRETSNNRAGTLKPIEIPPPRPKRKPSHPYPRKLGHLSCNKASFGDEQLWSFIAKQSGSEQESKSPTSVLTPFGSDTTERTAFDMLKPCTSPVSSADRTLSEQGSGSKFSSSAGYKDKQSPDPSTVLSMQDTSAMELDLDINEAPVATQQITTLKLFGRTVIVSGFQPHKNELELEESHSDCTKIDLETQKLQEQDKSDASLGEGRGESNPFYGGVLHNNLMSPAEPNTISLPSWWALYEGMPCGFSKLPSPRLGLSHHCDPTLKESSQTESSTSSCNNFSNSNKNSWKGTVVQTEESLPQSSVLKPSNNSVSRSMRPSCANSNRGFMPYRR